MQVPKAIDPQDEKQDEPKRPSDDHDSTISVYLNYFVATLVTIGIFVVDIFTDKGLLDGALIGVLITKVFDSISKQNEYFFPSKRHEKEK